MAQKFTTNEEVMNLVRKTVGDMADIRKTIETLSKRTSPESSSGNPLLQSRNKAFSVDRNGGRTDLADIAVGRTKSLGSEFGDFLNDVALMSDPNRFHCNPEVVMKRLTASGSKPVTKAVMGESTGTLGGYTVPPQFVTDLIRVAAEDSFLRSLCRTIPMTTRNCFVPALDQSKSPPTGGSAYFGGLVWQWEPENSNYQTLASTVANFRQIELIARDLVGIVVASNQLLQDNAVALNAVLTTIFAEAMAWAYDYFSLQGNGVAQPMGMLNSPCLLTVSKVEAVHVHIQDLAGMYSKMLPSSYKNMIWLAHPSTIPDFLAMTTSSTSTPGSTLVWLNPFALQNNGGPVAGNVPATIFGRPLYFTEKLPKLAASATGSVMCVDPMRYLIGDRMSIQVEASPIPNFVSNQMTWRIISRWDGQCELNAPITLADGTYQVSSVVALIT